jgi:hypothetical protein
MKLHADRNDFGEPQHSGHSLRLRRQPICYGRIGSRLRLNPIGIGYFILAGRPFMWVDHIRSSPKTGRITDDFASSLAEFMPSTLNCVNSGGLPSSGKALQQT